jgi:hypothetical protein
VRVPPRAVKLPEWDWQGPEPLHATFLRYNAAGLDLLIGTDAQLSTLFYVVISGQVVCMLRQATKEERETAKAAGVVQIMLEFPRPAYAYVAVTD